MGATHYRPAFPSRAFRRLPLLFLATLALFRCDFFDIFPPEIEIVSPSDNASCAGTLSCDIDATDNRSVAKVELFLDNVSIHEFTKAPYKASLDISGQSAGTKTFKAIAYDQAGNHAEAERQVRIEKESISTPNIPTGPSSGNVNTTYNYSTGGSTSSIGHNIQYRFDWDDGSYSNWSSSTTASHSWSSAGTYSVKAQARCTTHTSVVSNWSSFKSVSISSETISTPSMPTGPSSGNVGTSYSYTTGGASSSLGHSVQYRFDWGDGNYSNWSSSTSASHSWSSAGTYSVKAQARCATHTGVVSGWSSYRAVTIAGQWSPVLVGTYNTPGSAFGVFVSGSYAYVADRGAGLQVIDVSNPSSPSLAGLINTPGSAYRVFVSGNYAYVADLDSGLQIINVSNPVSPTLIGSYYSPIHIPDVFVIGNYAYVAAGWSGFQIINISNPASPTLEGSFNMSGYADGVFVSGIYAYVVKQPSGFHIINISNPTSPAQAGSYGTPDYAYGVFVSGNYAYVADSDEGGLQIINVSSPASPTLAGSYDTPGAAQDVFVSGSYAYVADRGSGLQVINISNPTSPTLAGSYDTPGSAEGVFVSGSYAYVADYGSGLLIFDVSGLP